MTNATARWMEPDVQVFCGSFSKIFHNRMTDVLLSWNKHYFLFITRNKVICMAEIVCYCISFWETGPCCIQHRLLLNRCQFFCLSTPNPSPDCWHPKCALQCWLTNCSGWFFPSLTNVRLSHSLWWLLILHIWSYDLMTCLHAGQGCFHLLALLLWCFGSSLSIEGAQGYIHPLQSPPVFWQ